MFAGNVFKLTVTDSCTALAVLYIVVTPKITRNSSRDEIANVNFLHNDIVHAVQNTIDLCINSPQIDAVR